MKKKNLIHGILGLFAVITGFVGKSLYRPYAYENGLRDYGFADFSPSLFYVLGFSQLLLIKPSKHPWLVITVVTLGSVGYEMMQAKSNGIIDVKDMVASVFGGFISLLIWKMMEKKKYNN